VDEAARRAASPGGEGRRVGKAIEGVVDLDRIEAFGVMLEPSGLGQVSRIKISPPVLVLPARTADTYVKM